jgi:hypothetical protein
VTVDVLDAVVAPLVTHWQPLACSAGRGPGCSGRAVRWRGRRCRTPSPRTPAPAAGWRARTRTPAVPQGESPGPLPLPARLAFLAATRNRHTRYVSGTPARQAARGDREALGRLVRSTSTSITGRVAGSAEGILIRPCRHEARPSRGGLRHRLSLDGLTDTHPEELLDEPETGVVDVREVDVGIVGDDRGENPGRGDPSGRWPNR